MTGLAERVGEQLANRGLRLAIAESCTGGLMGARLTDPPGASRFLVASVVTYSDEAKVALLGVRPETLAADGAVSETVAREMLEGAVARLDCDAGIAITGVAGPGGGTPVKPGGTVWIAVSVRGRTVVRLHRFDGDRAAVRAGAVRVALEELSGLLEGGA
jgi:nicotinamide-nucleotide amidase